ncbi:MAG: ethanolamine utilization protein EutJ [Anaerolineaceae bacterium]|nr:ethanolamine utilization protein EutJ [Anaerolineaceae bacterium]
MAALSDIMAATTLQADESLDLSNTHLKVGVDLGTAYLVMMVLDTENRPLAGSYEFAQVVRDGLVVDFIGAVDRLKVMKAGLEKRLGCSLEHAVSAYPPGVPAAEQRATAYVLESAGLDCSKLIDEPSAANGVLGLKNGAVVDVGGGTTGVAILQDGEIVYTADEATGGTHFSLVIAGALNLSFEEAEQRKKQSEHQQSLFAYIRPVMEKVASIVDRHVQGYNVEEIVLVGGTSMFKGMDEVMQQWTGIPTWIPQHPMFVTPYGIAMQDK